jgi:hypothetical protein
MYTREKLQSALDALNIERAQIKSEGWYLQHCWLVQVKPGGNARTNRKYWQVRSRQAMFNGKTLKHLRADEVEDYRAAINRGRQLKQIDRQIEKLQQRLFALTTTTQTKLTLTDMAQQEHLVKEVLAESQKLRDSLRQLGILNQLLRTQAQESVVRSQESGVRSQESGVRSQESGVRSQESGVRSQESGVRSQSLGVRGRVIEDLKVFGLVGSHGSEVEAKRSRFWLEEK